MQIIIDAEFRLALGVAEDETITCSVMVKDSSNKARHFKNMFCFAPPMDCKEPGELALRIETSAKPSITRMVILFLRAAKRRRERDDPSMRDAVKLRDWKAAIAFLTYCIQNWRANHKYGVDDSRMARRIHKRAVELGAPAKMPNSLAVETAYKALVDLMMKPIVLIGREAEVLMLFGTFGCALDTAATSAYYASSMPSVAVTQPSAQLASNAIVNPFSDLETMVRAAISDYPERGDWLVDKL